jgi:hyaluronan synthase
VNASLPALASEENLIRVDRRPGWPLRIAISAGLCSLAYWTFREDAFAPLFALAQSQAWRSLVLRPAVLWATMAMFLLIFRTLLWFRYRAEAPADTATCPSLTVIIPAYNEGSMVGRAIDSVVAARYPRDRLELIVVDDGSQDDTWKHISSAASREPDLVKTIRLPENGGKRRALAEGFRRARGELLATIDSDSEIEPNALLSLVGPFRRQSVGAVAGRVAVYNRWNGIIPRMLAVRFVLMFDLLRAVQSTYGSVYCCPGALTAYRTKVVLKVLDAWLDQRFLGVPCTIGEDRALTNAIFAEGLDTVYQRTATVHTVVPQSYGRLCKMLLRWERSYVREEIRYMRILWRRRGVARAVSIVETFVNNMRYPVAWASALTFITLAPSHPLIVVRMLCVIGLFSGFNMLYYLHSERSAEAVFGVLYAYFSVFALSWIFPYALLTVRDRGWLTR